MSWPQDQNHRPAKNADRTRKCRRCAQALGLIPAPIGGRSGLLACGHDTRGLVYALLDFADRERHAVNSPASFAIVKPIIEQPANRCRSLMKLFASDVEDKPWFNDREMWPHYLTMLATQRFNRFNLGFGLGYDFLRQIKDAYFLFALSLPVRGSRLQRRYHSYRCRARPQSEC